MQQVPTFAQANETVLAIHAEHWKSTRTEGQWRASMRDYVLPCLARKRVDAVTTAGVMAVLLPIWSTKRVTAGRVRQRIGAVMKWAVAQGYRDDNPAGDAISAALPKAAVRPTVRKQHMRTLPNAEVGAALQRVKGSGAYRGTMLAFEFLDLLVEQREHAATGVAASAAVRSREASRAARSFSDEAAAARSSASSTPWECARRRRRRPR